MQTLYLKYRPQKVGELNLKEVRETLGKVLAGKSWPHAWLFAGPRGTGKTSSARILAKAVNCKEKVSGEPCGKCEMCQEIAEGKAVDILEIDAASNRGIDEIRELREKIKLAPMKATYKVYIIDEVHMLTTEAANALLKTLEEPPEHALFVLCTTEPERLPETVLSRCTRIGFKKPSLEETVESLQRVAKGEKIKTNEAALKLVAKAARGSFRDGAKILEQVIMAGDEVNEETVKKVLGVIEAADPGNFLELLVSRQQKEALASVNEIVNLGTNMRNFLERVSEQLREQLLEAYAAGDKKKTAALVALSDDLNEVYEQVRQAAVPQLPVEVMILRHGGEAEEKRTEKVSEKPGERVATKPQPQGEVETQATVEEKKEEVRKPAGPSGRGKYSLEDMSSKWGEIMKAVRPKNHSVEALLRSTKPLAFDGEELTLEVFYKFHKDKLESEKIRMLVETAVCEVFGTGKTKLYLKLGERRSKKQEVSGKGVEEDILKAAEAIFKAEVV